MKNAVLQISTNVSLIISSISNNTPRLDSAQPNIYDS